MNSDRKRLAYNMAMQIIAFFLNVFISFFLTPFLVGKLGKEIHGYIGMAGNMTDYVAIFTVAINGMVGRYVTIEISRNKPEKASEYFSSVLAANIIISLALLAPSMFFAFTVDRFIQVPDGFTLDIRLLFSAVFLSFLVSLAAGPMSVATYATNRLDLSSRRQMQATLLRALLLGGLFWLLTPHVWFVGLGALASALFVAFTNATYMRRLLPQVRFSRAYVRWKSVRELIAVGIWNSVNRLSQMLMNGLDLLIANVFINPSAMSLLSIGKSVPTYIISFIAMAANVFQPKMTSLYGKGDMDGLVKETTLAMRVCGFFCTVPSMGLVVFGQAFYGLWLPNLSATDIGSIQALSVLTLLPFIFSAFVYPLYNINTLTLKMKIPVLVSLALGVVSTLTVLILLNLTDLGIYAVAGVSSILVVLRILLFVPLYAAANLRLKWYTFYPFILRGGACALLLFLLFSLAARFIPIHSWLALAMTAGLCGAAGYALSLPFLFSRREIRILLARGKEKLPFGKK